MNVKLVRSFYISVSDMKNREKCVGLQKIN